MSHLFRLRAMSLLLCLAGLAISATAGHAVTAAEYRNKADACVARGEYAAASEYYRKEAIIYRKRGDINGALCEEAKANRWETCLSLHYSTPAATPPAALQSGAKFEPAYGCYLGLYVERSQHDAMAKADKFQRLTDKKLATAFTYCSYAPGGEYSDFPLAWARAMRRGGITPNIAWEPNGGLDVVQDDAYLRKFAKDAASVGGPVFLRFASEMNGKWTNYTGNPAKYKEKFRLVHDVMAKYAPNVAMIWCVCAIPMDTIERYYPGDQYVDWVGINVYSVLYHDDLRSRPADYENPYDLVNFVYNTYAARKPIAVCEYGATHKAACEQKNRPDFAIAKYAQFFAMLPLKYPRIKMAYIMDLDNFTARFTDPNRRLNNYAITDDETLVAAFRQIVDTGHLLTEIPDDHAPAARPYIAPLDSGATLSGKVNLYAWVKTYENAPTVVYQLDGKTIATSQTPGTYPFALDTAQYPAGKHQLTLKALDSHGRVAGSRDAAVVFTR